MFFCFEARTTGLAAQSTRSGGYFDRRFPLLSFLDEIYQLERTEA
jgi:hypothetical protein